MKVHERRTDAAGRVPRFFYCPGCDDIHQVTGWAFDGNLAAPTFSPSVLVRYYDGDAVRATCHSFVKAGRIEFLSDCTHSLAGTTVDLPDWEGNGTHWIGEKEATT